MASSDNLMTMEPWVYRTAFGDSWLADALSRETETISKALQKSFSSQVDNASSDLITTSVQTPTPTVSNGSENDNAVVSRRRKAVAGVTTTNGGKITKRKSRASKRATTTFITADPANFRQMVQQVTGVRLNGNGQLEVAPLLKPEPQRLINRLQQQQQLPGGGGFLPTLDTSAFLLDPTNQNNQVVGSASNFFSQPASVGVSPPSLLVVDGGSVTSSFDFDSFSSFPTLESWKM